MHVVKTGARVSRFLRLAANSKLRKRRKLVGFFFFFFLAIFNSGRKKICSKVMLCVSSSSFESIQWRIQRVLCRGGVTKSARSAAGGSAGGGYPLAQEGVRGATPGKIFEKWTQMVHSEPFFCLVRVDISQNLCVIFAFKAPISDIRHVEK